MIVDKITRRIIGYGLFYIPGASLISYYSNWQTAVGVFVVVFGMFFMFHSKDMDR